MVSHDRFTRFRQKIPCEKEEMAKKKMIYFRLVVKMSNYSLLGAANTLQYLTKNNYYCTSKYSHLSLSTNCTDKNTTR